MNIEINKERCRNLISGVLGIYIIYCLASIVQEWIIKNPYINRETGKQEYLKNANSFVLIPSLVSWIIGYLLNRNNTTKTQIPAKNLFMSSALVIISTLSFTAAIYITSFPMVMMVKSCNILSVLFVAIFCSRVRDKTQKIGKKKLITGLIITVGILLYNFAGNKEQTEKASNPLGIILLLVSLVCDGFLPDFQAQIKVNFKPTPLEMFEDMNRWKTYLSFAYCLISLEFIPMFKFFYDYPWCPIHLAMLGTLGAFGQMIVFWMIKLFKQHIVPFTITTRKLATVLISIIFFNHQTTILQFLGIIIVFVVVILDFTFEIMNEEKNIKDQMNPQLTSDNFEKEPINTEKENLVNSQTIESETKQQS